MRQNRTLFLAILLGLPLMCLVFAHGTSDAARVQPTVTQQRTLNFNGAGGVDVDPHDHDFEGEKYSREVAIDSTKDIGDEIAASLRQLQSQNKVISNHIVRLEFSGVTYASYPLNLIKSDLVDVVHDVLTTHLDDRIEVIDVTRFDNTRKLRIASSRKLSYIVLGVRISLLHPARIPSQQTLATTIEILREYVDNDFRRYMRKLPGNGDYMGAVDVTDWYYNTNFVLAVPITPQPVMSPTQIATGAFQFKLIIPGASPLYAYSEVLRNYIRYGVTQVLIDHLDSDVDLVDVSLQPWLPEASLSYPMIITLQFPKGRNDVFVHAEEVLSNNIGGIDIYLNNYLTTSSLPDAEELQLESTMNDIFGDMPRIEISIVNPEPTQAPSKYKPIKPANDWFNVTEDSLKMPWWGWLVLGVGLSFVVLCCCFCIVQFMKNKRQGRPSTTNNIIHVRKSRKETKPVRRRATYESEHADVNLNGAAKNIKPREPVRIIVPMEPNRCVPDPEEEVVFEPQRKKKKKKKKKQKKHRDP